MKRFAMLALALMAGFNTAMAAPAISSVTARQRYPWNGKVDITYTLSESAAVDKERGMLGSLKVTATDGETGRTYTATTLSGDTAVTAGTHSLVWDMAADGLSFVSTNVTFTVSCIGKPATYCVIDLSSGSSSSSFPVSYLASAPSGGFNVNAYKTTKLVLRRIEPGTFSMCGQYSTTLTKPYYIGVFEVTAKQYNLITGNTPPHPFSYMPQSDTYPVQGISYNMIRGSSNGAKWPASSTVDSSSILGKLRSKTGLAFDLPTEAQWEYACRAGTTSSFNNGGETLEDAKKVGCYSENAPYYENQGYSGQRPNNVGSYKANNWGLYDMHGNFVEWCLDWKGDLSSSMTDPKGASSGSSRVLRGGSYYWSYSSAKASSRTSGSPDSTGVGIYGFRLARPLTTTSSTTTLCGGNCAAMKIDLTSGTRQAALVEDICYSTKWETSNSGAQAIVSVNGVELSSTSGTGSVEWNPTRNGTYNLTHKVVLNGTQVGNTLSATFEVGHFPATPVITPAGGVVESWPQSVTISCATEGAAIHFTTNGSLPTADSPLYNRFRVSGRTKVQAIAIKDGLASVVAEAEFAAGRCADPVITPSNGTVFEHAGQSVSIAWQGEDGVLRYTTDGQDPTADSPAYSGPFTIDETTVVKAKAFGDQFFDSAIVTSSLTRAWVSVATPIITAAGSFTGSKTPVSISCDTEGATVRYTLNGVDPNSHAKRYTEPFYVAESCQVRAYATCSDYLDSEIASFEIEKVWGIGDTLGAPDHAFSAGGDVPFFRVEDATAPLGEAMQSGSITHSQVSTMTTTVMGPGTISFLWKASCEKDLDGLYEWDHAEFLIDGTIAARIDGETGWTGVTNAIAGDGEHTLLWRYVKDNIESAGEDCCWVADYRWVSDYTATQTTEVPVPYTWLRTYYPYTPDEYEAYETAAKVAAANDANKVWECYVVGLVPTNQIERFLAQINITNETARIWWTPDLNEGGTKHERVYTVEGKTNLVDKAWGPTNEATRFFRVKVEMP